MVESLKESLQSLMDEESQKKEDVAKSTKKIDDLLKENEQILSDLALKYVARHNGLLERKMANGILEMFNEQGIPAYYGFVRGLMDDLKRKGLIVSPRIEYARGEKDKFVSLTGTAKSLDYIQEILSEVDFEQKKGAVETVLNMTRRYGLTPSNDLAETLVPMIDEGYLGVITKEGLELRYRVRGREPSLSKIKRTDI
jgi:hypothetical protein